MLNIKQLGFTVAACLCLQGVSNAIVITLFDPNTPIYFSGVGKGGVQGYKYTFDISPPFLIGSQTVHSGSYTFVFSDSNGNREKVAISLGSEEIDYLDPIANTGQTFSVGSISLSGLNELNTFRQITYFITRDAGEFTLDSGSLTVNVPDGGATVALLGLGLIGTGALRRFRGKV